MAAWHRLKCKQAWPPLTSCMRTLPVLRPAHLLGLLRERLVDDGRRSLLHACHGSGPLHARGQGVLECLLQTQGWMPSKVRAGAHSKLLHPCTAVPAASLQWQDTSSGRTPPLHRRSYIDCVVRHAAALQHICGVAADQAHEGGGHLGGVAMPRQCQKLRQRGLYRVVQRCLMPRPHVSCRAGVGGW